MSGQTLYAAVFLAVLMATAGASTVTLTGSCSNQLLDAAHNSFTFNLTNSGNGTAMDFELVPVLSGMSSYNSMLAIPVVAPGGNYSLRFYAGNFSMPGGYAEYLLASYSQGSDVFTTFFPCLLYANQVSQSMIRVSAVNQSGGVLSVTLLNNDVHNAINATVHVQAPLSFSVPEPNSSVTVAPYSQRTLHFNVSVPQLTSASFPIGVSVSYASSGVHYATIAQTVVSFGSGSKTAAGPGIAAISIAVVVVAILLLIAASVIKRRGAGKG